jgi:internalin A
VHLDLSGCEHLITLPALQNLESLRHLDLHDCIRLTTLIVTGLTSLQYLNLSRCYRLRTLTDIDKLLHLHYLNLNYCKSLCSKLNLTGLIHLQHVDLGYCDQLTDIKGINTLMSLQQLDLSYCRSLCSELNLTGLIHLQDLDLYCAKLVNVQGIDTLVSLRTLILSCSQLHTTPDLSKLTLLEDLNLCDCTALPAVTGVSKLVNLIYLNLRNCNSLSTPLFQAYITALVSSGDAVGTTMTALQSLGVSSNSALAYFQAQQLPALVMVEVRGIDTITTIDCSIWPSLLTVNVEECSNLTKLQGLDKLTSLQQLWLKRCPQLECLPELSCFETLQRLSVHECTALSTIYNKLTDFKALRELDVCKSGIGQAMYDHSDVQEQVTALEQRQDFQYRNYYGVKSRDTGCLYGDNSDCSMQ